MRFSMMFLPIIVTLAFLNMVTSTKSPGADPRSTITRSIRDASKRISIKRAGASRGLRECREQFKFEVWDCSFYKESTSVTGALPDFMRTTLSYANRETAYLHAITTAGIVQEIVSQCAANKITECSCDKKSGQSRGCRNYLKFAEKETRRLLVTLPQGSFERSGIDINNQMVGIEVFKRNCGGSLPKNCNNWQRVANELKSKYQSTINETQQTNINSTSQSNLRLTYQDPSPDYCVRNLTVGSPGLEGRVCGNSGTITSQCRSLCEQCGLTLLREDRSPRNCKDCPEITSVTVCRKKKIVTGKRSVEQSPVQMIGMRKHFLSLGTDV